MKFPVTDRQGNLWNRSNRIYVAWQHKRTSTEQKLGSKHHDKSRNHLNPMLEVRGGEQMGVARILQMTPLRPGCPPPHTRRSLPPGSSQPSSSIPSVEFQTNTTVQISQEPAHEAHISSNSYNNSRQQRVSQHAASGVVCSSRHKSPFVSVLQEKMLCNQNRAPYFARRQRSRTLLQPSRGVTQGVANKLSTSRACPCFIIPNVFNC